MINGDAIIAGSNFNFFASNGNKQPSDFANATVAIKVIPITTASNNPNYTVTFSTTPVTIEVTDGDKKIILPIFRDGDGKSQVLVPYSWDLYKAQAPGYLEEVVEQEKIYTAHLIDLSMAQYEPIENNIGGYYTFYDKVFFEDGLIIEQWTDTVG